MRTPVLAVLAMLFGCARVEPEPPTPVAPPGSEPRGLTDALALAPFCHFSGDVHIATGRENHLFAVSFLAGITVPADKRALWSARCMNGDCAAVRIDLSDPGELNHHDIRIYDVAFGHLSGDGVYVIDINPTISIRTDLRGRSITLLLMEDGTAYVFRTACSDE